MRTLRPFLILVTVLPLTSLHAASPQPPPCSAPEYTQFDFWLGDWDVTFPGGKAAGHNLVTKEYGGCVVQEHWTGAGGTIGSSFNTYDPARKVWHQTWVSNVGGLVLLEGGLKDGSMILSGVQVQPDGSKLINRVTWTPIQAGGAGKVRQFWETSADGGKTWQVSFDGLYAKAH